MTHPPAPWHLRGDLWCSTFWLSRSHETRGPGGERPRGLYGCALVDYRSGGVLTYRELLVARLRRPLPTRVTITDIWVDSEVSLAGGRRLWAIPKGMADLQFEGAGDGGSGMRLDAEVTLPSSEPVPGSVVSVTARTVGPLAVPAPFSFGTRQQREHVPDATPQDRGEVVTTVAGRARVAPARSTWEFAPDGALAWLRDARQVASFVAADFSMSFG
ncbi:acetoacetate decarboxylase family protein [Nocardioidaceae bacterium]|nr:acetoacetate decarboxylase family protein [Nocardioidaceae bacterium]